MIRLIAAGLGGMGRHDWMAAQHSGEFRLVAGIDPVETHAAAFREATGAPTFPSLTEAISAVEADAAIVATPDAFHAPLTLEAIAAGLDVICEKPMAETIEDARRMHDAARANGRLLMIHQQLRWSPAMFHGRRLIRDGAIGEVHGIEFDMSVFSGAALYGYRSQLRHMMLQDLAIHHFDLIRYLSGQECRSIYVKTWAAREDAIRVPTTTNVFALMEMTNKVMVRYTSKSRALLEQVGYGCAAVVSGSHGELVIRPDALLLQTHAGIARGDAPRRIIPQAPQRDTWQSFADAINTRVPTLTDSSENLHSLAMLFAAIRSANEDRVVHL